MFSIVIGLVSLVVFLFFQAQGIPAGDSGDLVTAAATFGVPHPPGYPLYTFLGWLLSKIPLLTVSWRVGLLSSLSNAVVIVLVYRIVLFLTKHRGAAVFSCVLLAGNYLFFLYSVTPEVFALLDFFIALYVYILLVWEQAKSSRLLYGLSFVIGLSLTHHHVVLFLFPAIVFFLWRRRGKIRQSGVSFARILAMFCAGLLPYIYVVVAGGGQSIVNWDKATTLPNFVRLVTRADYGTFQSGAVMGSLPIQRLIQIKVFIQYMVEDFTWVGMLIIVAGLYYLWKKNRDYAYFFIVAIVSLGPVFFSYASFPLSNRFTIATYERFLLPSYVLLSLLAGAGFFAIVQAARYFLKKIHFNEQGVYGLWFVMFLLPVMIAGATVWKFWGYASDRTGEYLAQDILSGIPADSLLVIDRDTPLFTTQYVRYVQGVRADIMLIHGSRLSSEDYRSSVSQIFPALTIPKPADSGFFEKFFIQNVRDRRVFSYLKYALGPEWFWVPHGLVYELLPKDRLPSVETMKDTNLSLWDLSHDPEGGILSRYNHLMLSDVRDVYTSARVEFGKTMMRAGDIKTAQDQFVHAIRDAGDVQLPEAYIYLGLSELFLNHCEEALSHLKTAGNLSLTPDNNIILYQSHVYRDCLGDRKKGQELYDLYIKTLESEKTPLKQL